MTKVNHTIFYGIELGIPAPAQVKRRNYHLIIPSEFHEGTKGSRRNYVNKMLGSVEFLLIPRTYKQTQT